MNELTGSPRKGDVHWNADGPAVFDGTVWRDATFEMGHEALCDFHEAQNGTPEVEQVAESEPFHEWMKDRMNRIKAGEN